MIKQHQRAYKVYCLQNRNNQFVMDSKVRANIMDLRVQVPLLCPRRVSSERSQCKSAFWKLKEVLDQSYEEEKADSPSRNSDALSVNQHFLSNAFSSAHTTSIIRSKLNIEQKQNSFLQMLRQKMPSFKASKQKKKQDDLTFSRRQTMISSTKSAPQKRSKSDNKDTVRLLRQKRRNILESIHESMEEEELVGQCNRPAFGSVNLGKRSSQNQKQKTRSLLQKMLANLNQHHKQANWQKGAVCEQKTQDSRQTELKPKGNRIMKNIVKMKNQLVHSTTDSIESSSKESSYIKKMTESHEQIENCHRRQVQFEEICSDIDQVFDVINVYSPNESPCFHSEQNQKGFKAPDPNTDNFTFGQLTKQQMKAQLQIMKKHMKKVSIEFEENGESPNKGQGKKVAQ